MSTLDQTLIQKYKEMVGFGNIQNISNNTTLFGNATINSNLFVSNNAILYNNTFIGNNLLVSSNTNILGNVSVGSLLVNNNSTINGNTTILSNLYISNNSNISNNLIVSGNSIFNSVTMVGSLNISGNTYLQNGINLLTIQPINNTLNFNSNVINIGNSNSIVNIIGSSNYVASSNLNITDKVVSLNLNASTATGFDIGNLSGIEILGTSGTGYIRTNITATRFEIKPSRMNSGYITILDSNNNLSISGTAIFQNNVTNLSSINILDNSNILGFTTINNNLNVSNNATIQGSVTLNSNLFISNNSIIQGQTTMNSNLNILNNSLISGTTTINSNLFISNNTIINNNLTINSLLNVTNNLLINGNTSISSSLFVGSNAILQSKITINNSLSVLGNTILNNTSIISNLYVSNNTIITGNISYNSNLNISGNTIIQGNMSVGSYFTLLGQTIMSLTEYPDNATAKTGGIPIWGLYRTGGIIKIRLNDIPPIITLTGVPSLFINLGSAFSDPGVSALDYLNTSCLVYLISISNTTTSNIITSPIAITGTTTISNVSTLSTGIYNITYQSTDTIGNISYNYRLLNILLNNSYAIYYTSQNIQISTGGNVYLNASGLYNSFIGQWSIKPSYLSSINLNYNANWSFIFKGTMISYGIGHYSLICFNTSWDGNNQKPNGNYSNDGVAAFKNIQGGSLNYLFNTNTCALTINNTYYFIISNINSYLNIQICSNIGTVLLNSSTLNPYTYTRTNLFEIYLEDTWQFTSGILINTNSKLTYQDYINAFGS